MRVSPLQLEIAINALLGILLAFAMWKIWRLAKQGLPVQPKPPSDNATKVLWALAIFNLISKVAKVGIFAFLGATAAATWDQMSSFERFCILLATAGQMLTVVEAFTDSTAAKLAAGKPPIGTNGSGHTQSFVKEKGVDKG